MAQGQLMDIKLSRFDAQPWGFRLQGGVDFAAPLLVQKVNGGSLAEQAGLMPGDAVLRINDVDVFNLRHKDAQDIVVRSGNNFVISVQRGGSTWRPHVTPTGHLPQPNSPYLQTVTKTSLAHKQQDSQHIGCGYNNSARPFANGGDGSVKSIVNKQYNTPVGIYSDESIAETLSAQAEVLAGGVLGVNFKKNEREYNADKSEVLRFLREEETGGHSSPAFNSQQYQEPQHQHQQQQHQQQHHHHHHQPQQHYQQQQQQQQSATRHVTAPINSPKPPSTGGLPTGQNICQECERLITGVFVRIKDKNLHVECFKCATCGTSLKNQGYYNFNNKLYCDIHAKLAAMQNPPSGTEGYVPVPIRPNTKLSVNTITSALSAHGYNGVSNGSSPAPAPVNQGYARPYGASAAPPAAAPKSPVSYPPQPQNWGAPQSKPAGNPYATLPRTNVGQQDRAGPVSMTFQPFDEHVDQPSLPTRTHTPSLTNKPTPVVPFYQTPEKLCFDESPATHARAYDYRAASPFPDRARSPAPGPPPNPLSAIRAPRLKENEVTPRVLQAGSITTGQSYLGAQQQQQQGQLLSHYEINSQTGMQNYTEKPESCEEHKIGDQTVQKREKESHLQEQQQSQLQSQTKTQIGNTQIERRRKVTEEFEHTQSAKTIEIRTGSQSQSTEKRQAELQSQSQSIDRRQSQASVQSQSQLQSLERRQSQMSAQSTSTSSERRPSYGKTGFVANQARRLSGLEQEITNLTTQSQAISARAANLTDIIFPQLKSPEPTTKFPTKPILPPYDEPKAPNYLLSAATNSKLVGPPPGFHQQQQHQQQLSTAYGASLVPSQQQQQQQKSLSAYSSAATTTSSSSSQANAVSCCLTKASATNNQSFPPNANAGGGICPVTGTYCRPGHTCCKQQILQTQPQTTAGSNNISNNSAAYRPNAFAGLSGFKPTQASAVAPSANAAAEPMPSPPAPTIAPGISDNSNGSGSAGVGAGAGAGANAGGKGGVYSATSAPKRGRGIMNQAVAPGVRIPLCNSCNIQIRGPFITALGRIWCPEHFICVNANCRRPLQDIGFVEEKGDLYCEYCFEKYLAPTCSKCGGKIKGDCLNAIGRHFHPECFTCGHCGKIFGNTPFFMEDGNAYCEVDWNELFTTKCFACGFPVEAGDRWVEALNHNYHSQCFNCTYCKQNLEGQSFYNKGGRPFCKNHAR